MPVLEEQRRYILDEQRNQSRVIAEKAVQNVLLSLGIRKDDHRELRADFELRWRRSVEQAGNYTVRAVITAVVEGVLGAVWLGVKTWLGK